MKSKQEQSEDFHGEVVEVKLELTITVSRRDGKDLTNKNAIVTAGEALRALPEPYLQIRWDEDGLVRDNYRTVRVSFCITIDPASLDTSYP